MWVYSGTKSGIGKCYNREISTPKTCTDYTDLHMCNSSNNDQCQWDDSLKICATRPPLNGSSPSPSSSPSPLPPPPVTDPSLGSICSYNGCTPNRLLDSVLWNPSDAQENTVVSKIKSFGRRGVVAVRDGTFRYRGTKPLSNRQADNLIGVISSSSNIKQSRIVLLSIDDYYGTVIQVKIVNETTNPVGGTSSNVHKVANPAWPTFRNVNILTFSKDSETCGTC